MRGQGVPLPPTPAHMRAAERIPEGHADLSGVLAKLGGFTVAMVLLPIGTYFASRDYLFDSNTTYSAVAAVVVANVILVGFIAVAFLEDAKEGNTAPVTINAGAGAGTKKGGKAE
ncbi:hypothetical protein JCM11251_003728 [Rhodosporidiobolus azoricus]